MAIRPKPSIYTCTKCDWRKMVHPQSDALLPGFDHFDTCPVCGSEVTKKELPKVLARFLGLWI